MSAAVGSTPKSTDWCSSEPANHVPWPNAASTGSTCSIPRGTSSTSSSGSGLETFRSEEHTSELQSRFDLVCRLLLEKKKKNYGYDMRMYARSSSLRLPR